MDRLVRIGSETAKSGFENEKSIAEKFNKWISDVEAQEWLLKMGYDLDNINCVSATVLKGHKSDVNVVVTVHHGFQVTTQNISIKKSTDSADFNQVDKRHTETYAKMWNMPHGVEFLLKVYAGETTPDELLEQGRITQEKYDSLKDKRRFFMTEFKPIYQERVLNFIKEHKAQIISDIIKGNDDFSADWMLVTKVHDGTDDVQWVLMDIDKVMSILSEGDVMITPRGSIKIGKVTLQRKGGDGGRDTAKQLQFKIKPCILFDYDN